MRRAWVVRVRVRVRVRVQAQVRPTISRLVQQRLPHHRRHHRPPAAAGALMRTPATPAREAAPAASSTRTAQQRQAASSCRGPPDPPRRRAVHVPEPLLKLGPQLPTTLPPPRRGQGPSKGGGGACYCYCGLEQAIGRCFNNTLSAAACDAIGRAPLLPVPAAAADGGTGGAGAGGDAPYGDALPVVCPDVSLLTDCYDVQHGLRPPVCGQSPMMPYLNSTGFVLQSRRACPAHPVPAYAATQECVFRQRRFGKCAWVEVEKGTCEDSPYFPVVDTHTQQLR